MRISQSSLMMLILTAAAIFLGGRANAASNEMTGFRYHTCDVKRCYVVRSPKAWLSQTNGAFVASGSKHEKNTAVLQILEGGKMTHEFSGDEVSSQPEINTVTVESDESIVLFDTLTFEIEVIGKPKIRTAGTP